MKYLNLVVRGGVMMWPILVCLFITLGVMIDRVVAFRRVDDDRGAFFTRLRNLVRRGDLSGVLAMCAERKTGLATMVHEAVVRRDQGEERVQEAMDGTGRDEAFRLEQRLPLLSVAATAAPLLGILGTLLGIIVAIRAVEIHPVAAGSALLAGRLWSALLPSAFGLAVGIPAYALHAYFAARVRKAVRDLEVAKGDILDLLEEPVHPSPQRSEDFHEKLAKRIFPYEEDEFFRKKAEARSTE